MKNFKNLKLQVEKVLKEYSKARNSDKWLTYKLWVDNYPSKVFTLERNKIDGTKETKKYFCVDDMLTLPDEQTITRIRRKFNQQGLYLATDPVILARRQKELKIKQVIKEF